MAYDENITITNWSDNATTQNLNFIAPSQFVFTLQRMSGVAFTCQTANIPNVSLQPSTQFSRVKDTPIPGDTITYGDSTNAGLLVNFIYTDTDHTELNGHFLNETPLSAGRHI